MGRAAARPTNTGWLLLLMLAGGCGEAGRVRIVDIVGPDGAMGLKDVEIPTLESIRAVRGTVAQLRGGTEIIITEDTETLDRGAARDQIVAHPNEVNARWIMEGDVAVPADFDSLAMLTTYAHLERAILHFTELGANPGDPTLVYYNPAIRDAEKLGLPQSDNAAFFPAADAFVLLPMKILQEIPFAMNPGVVGHEVAHRVYYYETWGGTFFATLNTVPGTLASYNLLCATDEGVADYFASTICGDPSFLAQSLPPEMAAARDLRRERTMDPRWVDGIEPLAENGDYDPYPAGSVTAAALWKLGELNGHRTIEVAVLEAERLLQQRLQSAITYAMGDLEIAVLRQLPSASRALSCSALEQSYAPLWTRFGAVCP